jgi:hypothetical protein
VRTCGGSFAACASAAGELVRHVELAHRDLDLHAGIVDRPEHLDHAAIGGVWPWALHDLDRHHLPAGPSRRRRARSGCRA